ncbi:MAG: hypothetical protein A2X82_09105 [Geobacteraceae bacterium GWC2_55_20]|nr:MAG: hypothetical protein A2X82_09105 [Geobacteraceae bacterium GWC2_55_20]
MQKYYTVQDLMTLLHVSRSKFYELVAGGLQPTLYLGSSPRWSDDDTTAFLAAQSKTKKQSGL